MDNVNWLRRTLTIAFWPFIDSIMTVFSNAILLHYGTKAAVLSTIVVMTLLNFLLFYLLSLEKELQGFIEKQSRKVKFLHKKVGKLEWGKTATILIVYTLSGPAMAGVPLMWVLGMRGKKAYWLIVIGVTMNSILWVGGIYHFFWILVHDVILHWSRIKDLL